MLRDFFAWMNRHERSLSALAMIGGFVVDQIFFGRIDLWQTQSVFAAYIATCFITIPLLHYLEARAEEGKGKPRWRALLPLTTQFALGGFWSGFVFFYGQAAALAASWPFLLLLVAVLIVNEVLKKYHERLVFTSILFFFALYSWAIFEVPIYVGKIGVIEFLESGVLAVLIFALFILLLRLAGRARFARDAWWIRLGASAVLITINIFYFTNVLPPLPLTLKAAGVYHSVTHVGHTYTAVAEHQPWYVALGYPATMHVTAGESLYAYTAVFAPVALKTTVAHRWEHYDPVEGQWITLASIAYPIQGGRDGGYLGYSAKAALAPGKWRVDIVTVDGRIIGRIAFTVVPASLPPPEYEKILN